MEFEATASVLGAAGHLGQLFRKAVMSESFNGLESP